MAIPSWGKRLKATTADSSPYAKPYNVVNRHPKSGTYTAMLEKGKWASQTARPRYASGRSSVPRRRASQCNGSSSGPPKGMRRWCIAWAAVATKSTLTVAIVFLHVGDSILARFAAIIDDPLPSVRLANQKPLREPSLGGPIQAIKIRSSEQFTTNFIFLLLLGNAQDDIRILGRRWPKEALQVNSSCRPSGNASLVRLVDLLEHATWFNLANTGIALGEMLGLVTVRPTQQASEAGDKGWVVAATFPWTQGQHRRAVLALATVCRICRWAVASAGRWSRHAQTHSTTERTSGSGQSRGRKGESSSAERAMCASGPRPGAAGGPDLWMSRRHTSGL